MDIAFDNTFDISSYGGKLFKASKVSLGSNWQIPDVKPATPEGKEIEKMVRSVWVKEIETFVKAKEKEYKEILKATELALYKTAQKKGAELMKAGDRPAAQAALFKWLDEEAKGANVMIAGAIMTFEGIAQKKMNELWVKIAAVVDKKFKTTISKAKLIAAVKITGLVILIVAAAAVTIAAAVLGAASGVGVLAGIAVALGGIATIASAASKINDAYANNWPNHKTAAATLKKKVEAMQEAVAYEEKKLLKTSQGATLGPKEKAKLFFANTKAKRAELSEAISSIAVWTASMLQDVEKGGKAELMLEQKLEEIEAKLKTETDKKKAAVFTKACTGCIKTISDSRIARTSTRLYLERYIALTNEGTALLATEDKLTAAALGGFLGKIVTLGQSKQMETLIAVGKSSADFLKTLIKLKP